MRITKVKLMWRIRIQSRQINCLDPVRCFDANSNLNSILATLVHGSTETYSKLFIINTQLSFTVLRFIFVWSLLSGVIFTIVSAFDARVHLVYVFFFIYLRTMPGVYSFYGFSFESLLMSTEREHHHTVIYFEIPLLLHKRSFQIANVLIIPLTYENH